MTNDTYGKVAHFQRGEGNLEIKGRWWAIRPRAAGETAAVTCPECGRRGLLEHHTIDDDGVVTPAVRCPLSLCHFGEARCVLVGWESR